MRDNLRSMLVGIGSSVGFDKWKLKRRLGHKFTHLDELEAMRDWRQDDWKKVKLYGTFEYYAKYSEGDFARIYAAREELRTEAASCDDLEEVTYQRLFLNHLDTYRQTRKCLKDCGWTPPAASLSEPVFPTRKAS